MKRLVIFFLIALAAGALLSAQEGNRLSRGTAPEKTTVSGKLGIVRGMIALDSGDTIYYVPGLLRFAGFIEGLKEGASVTLEGYESLAPFPDEEPGTSLRVTKMTLNGKDYDLDFRMGAVNVPRPQVPAPGFGPDSRRDNRSRDNRHFPRHGDFR
jgi:hypothetical protein